MEPVTVSHMYGVGCTAFSAGLLFLPSLYTFVIHGFAVYGMVHLVLHFKPFERWDWLSEKVTRFSLSSMFSPHKDKRPEEKNKNPEEKG